MDSNTFLQQARSALKAGDKHQARLFSQQALRADPQNHMAWMTLAVATPSPQAAMDYVQRAHRLRPDDPNVQKGMVWAKRRLAAQRKQQDALPTYIESPPVLENRSKKRPFLPVAFAVMLLLLITAVAIASWPQLGDDVAVAAVGETAVLQPMMTETAVFTSTPIPTSPLPQATIPPSTPNPIHPKQIAANSKQEAWPTWTTTPIPTSTPLPTATWQATFRAPQEGALNGRPLAVGSDEKWVDVNLSTQTLIAYEGDLPVMETLISSGLPSFETVTGQFRIWLRFESQTMDGRLLGYDYYLEDVPYVMYFFEDYALHGTYWHNNFGNPMSHGCVNMQTGDAEWIFNWSEMGTVVNVHY